MQASVLRRLLLLPILLFSAGLFAQSDSDNVFFTMGVHSSHDCNEANGNCIAKRNAGEPSDPFFPAYWVSDWTMYRVISNYEKNPPPYSDPPTTLKPGDYTVSRGTSYYDTTYVPADGDGYGAMMEHYEKYCLPIFPIKDNNYSCSFVSLGNKAYFLTYDQDRPTGMPACCMFSPMNHPPRQDFVKHLPYDPARSKQLDASVQAYSVEVPAGPSSILFGYSFYKKATGAQPQPGQGPFRHPQSFFFSGDTTLANAPIVSQNYSNFRVVKPAPAKTWAQVASMCPANPQPCQLFNPPATLGNGAKPQWNNLMNQKP